MKAGQIGGCLLIPFRYTKTERKELLKSLKILIDTREQLNDHITDYFDKQNITYKDKKLDFGDYSFYLPENKDQGIMKDIYFNNEIVVERKRSLDELSSNFTQSRTQFENELIRSNGSRFILLIEDPEGYKNIINHNYNTQYNPKSFLATLNTFRFRYGIEIMFLDNSLTGNFIYYLFRYYLREYLK